MPPIRRSVAPSDGPSSSTAYDRPSSRKPASRKPPTSASASASTSSMATKPAAAPLVDIPQSFTAEYDASRSGGQASGTSKGKGRAAAGSSKADEAVVVYTEDEKDQLLYEVFGVVPRRLLEEVVELCRVSVNEATEMLEKYLNHLVGRAGGGEERTAQEQREVDQGIVAIESLMVSHSDEALDKFVSWALRNTFRVPDGQQYTIPWQRALDYDRGTYIQSIGGNDVVHAKVEALRNQVEDVRKVEYKLKLANQKLDQKLKIAEQRQAEIAFVRNQQDYPHLSGLPLSTAAKDIKAALLALHAKLGTIELPTPTHGDLPSTLTGSSTTDSSLPPDGVKPWEKGRAAYLAWGVERVVAAAATAGGGSLNEQEEKRMLDALARETEKVSGDKDADGLAKMSAGLH